MKKLAVIGCGGIGTYHLDHLVKFDDIELVGFCDLIIERAENFVKIAGCGKAFVDFKEMYDEVNPDLVFIGIPPYKHGEVEFETIKRGIHMFIEKPAALDMNLANEISAKVSENKIITAVGFQCRYDNINDTAKDFIHKNKIVAAEGSRVGGVPEVDWWRKKDLSGGQMVEQTVHQIDILRYLFGDLDTVYSVARRGFVTDEEFPGYDTDDVSTTLFTFKSGLSCSFMTGCYSLNGASWDSKMTFGTRDARLDYRLLTHVKIFGVDEKDVAEDIAGVVKGDGMQRRNENEVGITVKSSVDAGTICDRTFIDAVINSDPSKIRSPYVDAIKTLEVVLACNESIKTGMPIKIKG